jgi:hypothetical protein
LCAPVRAQTPRAGEGAGAAAEAPAGYAWLRGETGEPIESRIQPPQGFERLAAKPGSFGAWLRGLPLKAGRPPVHLYNGLLKGNQEAHHAVVLIDVGPKNLQQCADAVIRLRAEYLYSAGCEDAVAFRFTSGDLAAWKRWREGDRPHVQGSRVAWSRDAAPDASYPNFRKYLNKVFEYAGTLSLGRELERVPDPRRIEIGDVYIQGGSPGHAVIVVDAAENGAGERVFLITQSYMPAQEIHVLRNPADPSNPWYPAAAEGALLTPEWTFRYTDLKRFPDAHCEREAAGTP